MSEQTRAQRRWWFVLAPLAVIVVFALAQHISWTPSAPADFTPHGQSYLWTPGLIRVHVLSDALLGASFISIAAALGYFLVRARRGVPFHAMIVSLGLLLVASGVNHIFSVWTIWNPAHWIAADVKLIAAIAAVAVACLLPTLFPRALALIEAAKVSGDRKDELNSAHQELQAAYAKIKELDERKAQFFANVSHELRTPLALIAGPARRLLSSEEVAGQQRDDLELIGRNANTLLKHVNELLDISRIEAGQIAPSYAERDLAQLVRFTASHFEEVSRERGIELAVSTPPSLRAEIDPPMFERVVLNLLSNAFTYTPEGGTVRVTLEPKGDRVSISVEDSGPGVEPELRAQIFDRYSQRSRSDGFSGIGLGLTIAKEFVVLHGGTIEIVDAPGARILIDLPIRAPSRVEVERQGEEIDQTSEFAVQAIAELGVSSALPHPGRDDSQDLPSGPTPISEPELPLVLIIEDRSGVGKRVSSAFTAGFRTARAFEGKEGVETALEVKPDLIISDLNVPGLNADALVQELRSYKELDGTPLIVVTEKIDEAVCARLLKAGAQDCFAGPFDLEQLKERSIALISGKRIRELIQRELKSESQELEKLVREVIAKKRELDSALRIARLARNQSQDHFLGMLSHELRTPLNAILGWVQLIRTDAHMEPDQVQQGLATIERNASAQTQLIRDLLDLSSIVSGKLRLEIRPLDLGTIAKSAVESVESIAEAKAIHIESFFAEGGLPVDGDPDRLKQAIRNLLFNAIKFTPLGGHVEIRTERTGTNDQKVRIVVKDTGQGIRAELMPHLFERFRQADSSTTRRHGGLGMGLAIARHLIERHGGTITGESRGEGLGATFTIEVPLAAVREARTTPRPPVHAEDQRMLEGLRVLVVDDDRDALELCSTVLEVYGAKVTSAASADEALALLDRATPDVLVSDIGMPDEDGYSLIKKVRGARQLSGADLPAVALTAYASEEHRRRAISAGFQMHLAKPVSAPDLARAVALVTERRNVPRPSA